MNCRTWRKCGSLGLAVILGAALQAGCKSASTSRSGVTSIQSVGARPDTVPPSSRALSVQEMNAPASGVIPANFTQSWTEPATGGECSH